MELFPRTAVSAFPPEPEETYVSLAGIQGSTCREGLKPFAGKSRQRPSKLFSSFLILFEMSELFTLQ